MKINWEIKYSIPQTNVKPENIISRYRDPNNQNYFETRIYGKRCKFKNFGKSMSVYNCV